MSERLDLDTPLPCPRCGAAVEWVPEPGIGSNAYPEGGGVYVMRCACSFRCYSTRFATDGSVPTYRTFMEWTSAAKALHAEIRRLRALVGEEP